MQDRPGLGHVLGVGEGGSGLGRRGARVGLVPVARPVVPLTNSGVRGFEEGVVQRVTKVTLHAVKVGTCHGRGVGWIGAPLEPPLGKVAALADVDGVGGADGPDRVLTGDGKAGEVEEVTGRLGHHRALPVESGLDLGVVAGMAVEAAVWRFHSHLARLGAGHPDEGVVLHGEWGPGIGYVGARQCQNQDENRQD